MNCAGILRSGAAEKDSFPIALPDGIVAFQGSAILGRAEMLGLIDFKITLEATTIEAEMTLDMANDMLAALTVAIQEATQSATDIQPISDVAPRVDPASQRRAPPMKEMFE